MRGFLCLVLSLFVLAACGTTKVEPVSAARGKAEAPDRAGPDRRVTLLDIAQTSKRYTSGIFGSLEIPARVEPGETDGNLISQWGRIQAWIRDQDPEFRACIRSPAACRSAELRAWRGLIVSARGLDAMGRLNAVNGYFNSWPYLLDEQVYGRSDYWATPIEFMRNSGDCEDFSIAKFLALRHLGFRNDDMRIVVVTDTIRARVHAVLAVYFRNDTLILDSLSDEILQHTAYTHYVAHYSVNETARWEHLNLNGGPLAAFDPRWRQLACRGGALLG